MSPFIIAITLLSSCDYRGESKSKVMYPEPMPDSVALSFLPGIVCTDSLDFNATFSPDGRSFYFTRSVSNKLVIYKMHHDGTHWSKPVPALFSNGKYSDADPAFSPDGKMYFISDRPKMASDTLPDYDIWFTSAVGNDDWSEPMNLDEINSDSNEFYISFSAKGQLYFSSSRTGGYGAEDIYKSEYSEGHYKAPQNMGPEINTGKSEYDPGISPDEEMLIFTSSNRRDTFGGGDLYGTSKTRNGKWQLAFNLGPLFNTKGREYCSYLTPDSRFFFFSSGGDVKWIDRKILMRRLNAMK